MLERIGADALPELKQYLRSHYHENILLLNDLAEADDPPDPRRDALSLVGYRHEGELIAVQGFYQYGRWFPHFIDDIAIGPMLDNMLKHRVRWVMGVRRVVDPFLKRLGDLGFQIGYDEKDYLCYVERQTFHPYGMEGIRRATCEDMPSIATLRREFESDYFGTPRERVDHAWCLWIAKRYIGRGAFVAERDGHLVSMVAVEAVIPELSQIAAVYTTKGYRGRGLAKGVVSAICEDQLLSRPRVTLTVKTDNAPALCVYRALGFRRWTDYRMSRFA